jgi:hypothetical protein
MATDPFAELHLTPTLDLAAIKRAYFAALKRSPPHADPEGFKRIRAAYEDLLEPTRRTTHVMSAPLDGSAWEASKARYETVVDLARAARENPGSGVGEDTEKVDAFVKTFSVQSLSDAIAKVRPSAEPDR